MSKKMKRYMAVLMLLIIYSNVHSQTPADSLIRVLERTYKQEDQLAVLNQIVQKLRMSHPDTALYFGYRQRILAKQINNEIYYISATWNLGKMHKAKGNLSESFRYLLEANEYYNQTNQFLNLAISDYVIGQLFYQVNSYEKSIEFLKKALKNYQKVNQNLSMAQVHYELGRSFRSLKKYEHSIYHIERCLSLISYQKNKALVSKAHNQMGIINYKLKHYQKSIREYTLARYHAEGLPDYGKKSAIAFNNIGEVFMELNNYHKADSFFNRALMIKRELGNQEFIAGTLINLGKLALKINDHDQAIIYLEEVVNTLDWTKISQHLEEAVVLLLESCLSNGNLSTMQVKKIAKFNKVYIEHSKLLKIQEYQNRMGSLLVENSLKKEIDYHYQNTLNAQNKFINFMLIVAVIIFGLLLLIYYREKRFKSFAKNLWQDLKDL